MYSAQNLNGKEHVGEGFVMEIKESEARIIISKYFDREWYISQYPDVAGDHVDPVLHYIRHGAAEGRWPRADFDSAGYLVANADVAAAAINPLVHWVTHGRKEGRPRGLSLGGRGYHGDINEILPECLRTIDFMEKNADKSVIRKNLWSIDPKNGIFGLSVDRIKYPIILYSAESTPVPLECVRQALFFTNADVYIINKNNSEYLTKYERVFQIPYDGSSLSGKLKSLLSSLEFSYVGLWETSLAPAVGAWSLLQATIERHPHLAYVGAAIVRSSGLLWRSGHRLAQRILRPQARGDYFLDPRQFRLKPTAAIDPMFGLYRADHLATALQAAMDACGERTAAVLQYLSLVANTMTGVREGGDSTMPWATQGCALVMSDVVPLLDASVDSINRMADEIDVQEGIVFVDSVPPQPDQDAGSVTAINFLDILLARNAEVFFYSTTQRAWSDPYVLSLAMRGVICLSDGSIPNYDVACEYIHKSVYSRLVFFLTRVYAGGEYVEITRARFPQARLIFNTVDLHGLRELREARIAGSKSALFTAYATSARERDIIRRCDATILLSEAESAELTPVLGYANLHVIPLVAEFSPPKNSFHQRRGAIFIGSFVHQPNIDSVEYIIEKIWGAIIRRNSSISLTIVGPHFPDRLRSRLPEGVEVAGFVDDLRGTLEKSRLTIAPLRYGAGIKGKIATSLSHGVPCVATGLAVEGMGMEDGGNILVADDPENFAEMVVQLHEDEVLWSRMSRAGYNFAASQFSKMAVASKLNSMLDAVLE